MTEINKSYITVEDAIRDLEKYGNIVFTDEISFDTKGKQIKTKRCTIHRDLFSPKHPFTKFSFDISLLHENDKKYIVRFLPMNISKALIQAMINKDSKIISYILE